MEDANTVGNGSGSLTEDCRRTTAPDSLHPFSTTMSNFTDENFIENQAVSMESNDCSSALSSPAEDHPPKPAGTPLSAIEGTKHSTATSNMRSAADSSKTTVTGLIDTSSMPPFLTTLPLHTFGNHDEETDFPTALTHKNVTVTLECNSVWKQFHSFGTEMILTKPGRRMFPYCRYHLSGLNPERLYRLFLSIYPSSEFKYRWNWSTNKWETYGAANNQTRSQIQAFFHNNKSLKGADWMSGSVSFYKLKLTNNCNPQDNHVLLNTMHRYIPRLHVIPVLDGDTGPPELPVVLGPDSMTFIFPQTEFMAVSCYQNNKITQLKINYNPFARGFKKSEDNQPLNGVNGGTDRLSKKVLHQKKDNEEIVNLSAKSNSVSTPRGQQTRLVLKPFMSTVCGKDERFVACFRGKHALGELVLVEEQSVEGNSNMSLTPKLEPDVDWTPTATSVTPRSSTSTPRSSPGRGTKRKLNTHKCDSRKAVATDCLTASKNPSPTVVLQPELDDVEGHVFVSFTSKEALDVHLKTKPAQCAAATSPRSPMFHHQNIKAEKESDEEIIANMEAVLLKDLKTLRHRQVIHPVLQKVGLKLGFLNSDISVDLQYLGVDLPLPPASRAEHVDTMSPSVDKELPFISRTGKTSDVTKIKGWKHKFIKGREKSANCVGLPKNLSAFCSDMLDEYLESEAKKISERAEAFSTNPEASVAYELPARSSSYVKTLDSVLKNHCKASNKPCPLSYKSHIPTARPPSSSETNPAQSTQERVSSRSRPESSVRVDENKASGSGHISDSLQRSCQHQDVAGEKPALTLRQKDRMGLKPLANSKVQLYLSQMEIENMAMGLKRTELTTDRLELALSTIVSKEMVYSKSPKQPKKVWARVQGPECGQEFCILGCVCSSLQHQHKSSGSLHCRRPECMLECECSKGTLGQQLCAEQGKLQLQPFSFSHKTESSAHCHKGSHTNRLWIKNINDVDSEPLFVPTSSQNICVPNPAQPVQEKDKDPVYRYLESKMTCARVRAFNSKPPPEVNLEPKITDTAANDTVTMELETSADSMPNSHAAETSPTNGGSSAETTSQGFAALEKNARKQIQIQSHCKWDKDKKAILKVLCLRLHENKLTEPFLFGPYNISPISKIFMRTPSNSIVTYKVQISKQSKTDEGEDKVEERLKWDDSPEKKVTPFLCGVLTAGILRARTKTPGFQTNELIEVNNKFYNRASLLLGGMGSLHPANRLAAFVTGRLNNAAKVKSTKSTQKDLSSVTQHTDLTDSVGQAAVGAKNTTDLNKDTQPLAMCQPVCGKQSSSPNSQHLQGPLHINPGQNLCSAIRPYRSSQRSSPFLLTVSDSLKTPNFLRRSGTCSFRICPPANQPTPGQNRSGVTLPGGFTLFELPKPAACENPRRGETVNATKIGAMTESRLRKQSLQNLTDNAVGLDTNWLGLDSLLEDEDVQSSGSPEPGSPLEMSTDESDDGPKDINVDLTSGDEGSHISDYSEEDDEDDEFGNAAATDTANQEILSRYLMEEPRNASDFRLRDPSSLLLTRSLQLKMLERLKRRNLQRSFEELQAVIGIRAQTSRAVVLERATRAIYNLDQTCMFLEKKKEWLMDMNALYVKQLSFLSGKSEVLILDKINQICRKQEMEEKKKEGAPFFSKLLQSRAALLQSTLPESEFEPPPPVESNLFKPPCEPISDTAAEQKLRQMMASFQADRQKYQNTAKKFASFWEKNRSLSTGGAASDSHSAVNSGALNSNSVQMSPAVPLQPFSLPLVRSKAGRIILPSFMKPVGNTVLRIQLVQSTGDGEMQPPDVDAKNQENRLASESSCKSEEDKSTSSNSDVKFSQHTVPMITFDQSVLLKALETEQNKQKGSTVNVYSSCPGPSPGCLPVDKLNSVNETKNPSVDEEIPKHLGSGEHTPEMGAVASNQPGAVKRGRGRPRKHPRNSDSEPTPKKPASSMPKDDRPVRLQCQSPANRQVNAAANSSRPLTRGALGKDFPSTKKRSWIDLEKELELDWD